LKPYLENPMEDIPKVEDMYEMPHMMYMQNMYQMMQDMCQMMDMCGMCPMMSMHDMCPAAMNMQGMKSMYPTTPMMEMDELNQRDLMYMQDDMRQIPMLASLMQISPNQIQISYDRDVDMRLGMRPSNYWIQDTMNVMPQGIATLGKNDRVNNRNSLTASMVRIDPKGGSANTFILTFNRNIPRGAEYKLIICYVTVKGAPPYSGDNGMATFIGK